jgi:hypothetical protein
MSLGSAGYSAASGKGRPMLIALLILLIIAVIVFGVLSFAVHHLFLIGFIIAIILLLGHLGFLGSRRHA